ncbi:LacI family DNA-binding transcriptional regulator [Marinifilum sp. RC60d5]|uniref:LacI family DNA-binding transcriptional regulator n=1 Tax=Marinifilum sp. RC60d5 TaxID=3458414 RepID=UPI0040361E42
MANIKDIAKLAGVSKSTVSRVVSNNGFVKEETRSKIMKVMDDLNYRPNMFAKGMRTNRSFSIGILFPDLKNPFFTEWYSIVDTISRERGYLNYICVTDPNGESEEKRIDDLLARSIDGIILFSYRKDDAFIKKLRKINKLTPILCCDSMFLDSGLSCICANGKKGTYKATQKLIESGSRHIAYIKGKEELMVVNNRFDGYLKCLADNNLKINDAHIINAKFTRDCGYKAAEELMALTNPPDAIMAATDLMAMGVLDYLNNNSYHIPDDVSVFGYDNLVVAKNTSPPLSTIALPFNEIAEKSINTLIKLIEEDKTDIVVEMFDCELKMRNTTK